VLFQSAEKAGTEVRRGARVCGLQPIAIPSVSVERDGRVEELRCHSLVCADGEYQAHASGRFEVHQYPYGMLIVRVLLEAMPSLASEANYWIVNSNLGQFAFLDPNLTAACAPTLDISKSEATTCRTRATYSVSLKNQSKQRVT
jgi:flavin-dependent dehydrogenase